VINYPLEGELVTRPGDRRYWNVSYFPVLDADGSVQAITAASLEVTQQKKAEQALLESEKLAVVGRLASSIAHEINNPLAAVTNLLYLAGISDDLFAAKGYVLTAQRELLRASAIANQTLRFHRQTTRPLAVTAQELLKSVVSLYQGRVDNANIRIEERYHGHQQVRCYEGEIRQVLSNLLNNAIDAMQPHGGKLMLRSRVATDWPTGRRGLAFTVADSGSGIEHSLIAKIFEPFFTTKEETGTGLGLWVSERIVKRHHGTLCVRSSQREGRSGTVFVMFLPFDAVTR
jgi:signal transduction histidine kinase